MKYVPNIREGRVDRDKITEYLLNREHPDGRSKAEFFQRYGFDLDSWETFATALRHQAENNPVAEHNETTYGTLYTVDGTMESPDGRNPNIRTVWIVEQNSLTPRLITAYPDAA